MSIDLSSRQSAVGRLALKLGITLALLISLTAPIALSPQPAAARAQSAGTAYTTDYLNLRTGPSTGYDIILVMPPGSEVGLTGDEMDGFAGVVYGGYYAWAATPWLSSSTGVEPVEPVVAAEPEVAAQPEVVSEPAAPAQPVVAPSSGGGIVDIIYAAAAAYGQDGNAMLAVATCESGLNPGAYNASSAASGLFQFLPSTWATTPYAGSNIFDASASANAAAWMWSQGRRGEWVC